MSTVYWRQFCVLRLNGVFFHNTYIMGSDCEFLINPFQQLPIFYLRKLESEQDRSLERVAETIGV